MDEMMPDEFRKPLEGTWWKYGLGFAVIQVGGWLILGYALNAELDLSFVLATGYVVYGTFIILGFLPFIFGRIGLRALMWTTLTGVLLGLAAYYLLALYEPTRRSILLPFYAYMQLAFAGLSIGTVWQFGKFVLRKVRE